MSAGFCSQCGNALKEGQRFCPACGSPVEGDVNPVAVNSQINTVNPKNDRMDLRNSELKIMDELIRFFSVKQPVYDEYDRVSNMIYRLRRSSSKAALIWSIILLGVGFFCTFMGLTFLIEDSFDDVYLPWLAYGILFLGIGGALMGVFVSLKKKRRNRMVEYTEKYYELSDELYQYYCGYENCPIGPEYTNPSNLAVVQRTIVSGRADTIKEALNLLVEDAYRDKMENLASQTAQYAQQAAQYAQQTAVNSDKIRRNTGVTAVFTIANYFK